MSMKAVLAVLALSLLFLASITGCGGPAQTSTPTPTASPTGSVSPTPSQPQATPTQTPATVAYNDSAVAARLVAVNWSKYSDMPTWKVDMEVYTSTDVFGVANNFTKDKVGQVITVYTNQYMQGISLGQGISCNVKLVSGGPEGSYFFTERIN